MMIKIKNTSNMEVYVYLFIQREKFDIEINKNLTFSLFKIK